MLSALFLPIIIIVLFLLRQNLIVILGIATAYAYWAFGDGVISNIVVDAWDAANKDILLSIPLFILAGNIMSRGGMASRLIDLMTSLTAVNEVIKSMSRDAIPPLDMIFPASMNNGMESNMSLFAASHASTTILLMTPSPNAQ